jgi:hypothetical protein
MLTSAKKQQMYVQYCIINHMRLEILTVVKISMLVFWVVTQCEFVGRNQHFGRTYCLQLQGVTTNRPTSTK